VSLENSEAINRLQEIIVAARRYFLSFMSYRLAGWCDQWSTWAHFFSDSW